MATSVDAAVIDALYTNLASLLSAQVFDGPNLQWQGIGDFLMIGVESLPSEDDEVIVAADWTQVPGPFATTRPRDQDGEIPCVALSWNGDGDWKAARDGVKAITDVIENLLRTNPTLGVTGVLWTGYGSTGQLMQSPTQNGATAFLSFRVSFRARI